ncbi:MAG: outer membrane beta-barrel protein, partial [Candidatus Eisenbacteria bacterium]|nr:outer membrane beta-barrel protein [Candidatus Eisenbacteria bacterium]
MRLASTLLAALLLLPSLALAQVTSIKGRFLDPTTNAPVPQVAVKLTSFADSADVKKVTAKDDGTFEVTGLGVHSYRLEATRVGYSPLKQIIRVSEANQNLGVLQLMPEAVNIAGVTVTESPSPAIQKADTTEFRASAVKTGKDATAEDLVQKMPGVTLEGGQVKAQGENVQQVLVNGRPFFGSDPAAAMRNLPAEVVDRIQVYDRSSDQAEFSGFDDGQQQKTMNFILRDQKARFGKVYGGFGDDNRYQGGGNATWLKGVNRLTLIGLSNNINQRNFSPMDLFGAMSGNAGGGGMRMMGGGGGGFDPSSFFVNQQGGITTTHSGGANYAGQWGKKLAVTASSFVNDMDNENSQLMQRQFLPPQDSLAFYDQTTGSDNKNGNQRFDARFEWTIDSLNSVIVQPRLYFQQNRSRNLTNATNSTLGGSIVNTSDGDTRNHTTGNNLSNRVTLRHRFAKRGRNVSADVNMGHNERDGDRVQRSLSQFITNNIASADTVDQLTNSGSITNSISTRIAYTEPLTKSWQAQLTYNPQFTRSESDARALALDPAGAYTQLDSTQSNSFVNRNTVQNGGAAVLFTKGPWRWLSQASVQQAKLQSEQEFPESRSFSRTFSDVLPSMTLSATFANRRNVRINWNTSTNPPSINQLQNVVDNSNPLALSAGNPDLRQTYANAFTVRLSEADPMRSKSRFLFLNLVRTNNPIGNATFTAPRDTVVDGIALARGTQLTRPENLDEAAWTANAFAVYSRPAKFLK